MDLKTFYEVTGSDYNGTMNRLMKEDRIVKFLRMFAAQNDYASLKQDVEQKNYEKIFLDSHSLKGVAANLGLSRIADSSSDLCEATRNGAAPSGELLSELFAKVESAMELFEKHFPEIE